VRIIRAGDCKATPWKNGDGSTTEIAIGPAGASLEAFDWRVSMARVASMGHFPISPASTAPSPSSRETVWC
jgi:environmental stress-induced protein Ves